MFIYLEYIQMMEDVNVLSNKYVRTIMLSNVLLQLGVWVRNFAILLYVTEITHNDPYYVSLISVAEYGPLFLFAIIGEPSQTAGVPNGP